MYGNLQFSENITELNEKNVLFEESVDWIYGDETVDTLSLYLAPLKWAHEFDHKLPNSKPIKIVDFCSHYNEKYTVYDNYDERGEKRITKNEFLGI